MKRLVGPSVLQEHPGHADQSVHGRRGGTIVRVDQVSSHKRPQTVTQVAFTRRSASGKERTRHYLYPRTKSVDRLNNVLGKALGQRKIKLSTPVWGKTLRIDRAEAR